MHGANKLRYAGMKKTILSAIWARDLKKTSKPCPRPKTFKEYRFEGPKLLGCPARTHVSGRPCTGHRFGQRRTHQRMAHFINQHL